MKNVVVLTGAGISRESGLDTFRDVDGIWAKVNVYEVATPAGFTDDPDRAHNFYNVLRRRVLSDDVRPNAAHIALAKLEQSWPGRVVIVTQNVDDLHERAGSTSVLHMHGEILKARCAGCGTVCRCVDDLNTRAVCVFCGVLGKMRPDVVWFGEIPMGEHETHLALQECNLFVAVGTSGNVYPAAGFVQEARRAGAHTVELNLEPSTGASLFHEKVYGPATRIVHDYVEELLAPGPDTDQTEAG